MKLRWRWSKKSQEVTIDRIRLKPEVVLARTTTYMTKTSRLIDGVSLRVYMLFREMKGSKREY